MTKRPRKPKSGGTYELPTAEKRAIGQRLKTAREIAGLTQTEAAEALGYSQPVQLSNMEAGNRAPPLDKLVKLAELYGTSTDYILGLADDSDRDPASSLQRYLTSRLSADVQSLIRSWSGLTTELVRKVMPTTAEGQRMAALVFEVSAALERVRQMNPSFDDKVKGAAPLLAKATLAAEAAKAYMAQIDRTRRLLSVRSLRDAAVADGGPPVDQLPLMDPPADIPAGLMKLW